MEINYNNMVIREQLEIEKTQVKIEQKYDMPEGAKKVVGVTSRVYLRNNEIKDNDVVMTGDMVVRIVYINEFEKYDSKEIVEAFERKIFVKDIDMFINVMCAMDLMDCKWGIENNIINISSIASVNLKGVRENNIQIVSDLDGDVEVRKNENHILMFDSLIKENFEIEETIELDKNCEGVLGVDLNACIKDVICNEGKISVKGVVSVNMMGVKMSEDGSMPYSTTYDIDFSKSITVPGILPDDVVGGDISVSTCEMKIENNGKGASLILSMGMIFNGISYMNKKFSMVTDAISFDKELSFENINVEYSQMLPQANTMVDIENNINVPSSIPYISKVLSTDGVRVVGLNIVAGEDKISVEGIISANVLIENEEHMTYSYLAEAPFQFNMRLEGVTSDYKVEAAVSPMLFNVKARRGVELLIDAKIAVSVVAKARKIITMMNSITVGKDKVDDGSAIRIYIVGEKEELWDVAKRTNLSSKELIRQNPNLENGCNSGEKVVVYRHENINI